MACKKATADVAELARFNRQAHTWWDEAGPMWPLHLLNRFRIQAILDVLHQQGICDSKQDKPLAALSVLDVGCGGGILSESLCKLGAQVCAIDLAENSIAIARRHAAQANLNIDYGVADISDIESQFDIVFNLEVVEHVNNPDQFLAQCAACVKSSGIMFVATINRTLLSYFVAIIGAEYILRLLPRGTHQWRKFIKPEQVEQQLADSGLKSFWATGVGLNPFNRHFYYQNSLAVNYMLAVKK